MQMAAREAIARLRDVLPVMKTRRYRYLPCHVPYTCHYAFSCPRGERDEAFEMLIEYLRALEAAFDNLVDDFVAARMDSVHCCAPTGGSSYPPHRHCLLSRPQHLMHLLVACLLPKSSTKLLRPLQRALHHPSRPLLFMLFRPWRPLRPPSAALHVWSLLARRKSSPQPRYASPSAGQRRSSTSPPEYAWPPCNIPLCTICLYVHRL